ncbi:EmmdR/YeeO family multidrug/toxin efflux MATE transporter [Brooklawnia cerclae]|uniref:Probable multidrug resistance protein NorM n=1 Tax=Brooklawnia cerclae TaxID=349934 RepID=A0ABX0SJ79_9ACTN|nr:putative MATE family efflux protein [Brooklawnia cerclae]
MSQLDEHADTGSFEAIPDPVDRATRPGGGRVDALLRRWFATSQLSHRAVGALLLPVIVSQAFTIGFTSLTPMVVANAGPVAVSAVSTVEYVNIFVVQILIALATAGSIVVAQNMGRGSRTAAQRSAGATLWVTAVPALVVGVALLVASDAVANGLLGPAGDQAVALGRMYLFALALGYPAQAIVEAASASLRGVARTAPALYLTVAMSGGFLALAVVLVRTFDLGVMGLAIAVVATRYPTAALALWLVRHDRVLGTGGRLVWPIDATRVRQAVMLGLPFVAEQVFFNGGKVLIQMFVVGMGTVQITANAVANSLVGLSDVVGQAMCLALVPIVGQAIGAGRPDDARRLVRSFVISSSAVAVIVSGVMLAGFDWLLDLFNTPARARSDVLMIFGLVALARLLCVWSMSFMTPSGLRAAGDAVYTTVIASVSMLLRVAGIWYVGVHLGYGVVGVWAVMVAEWVLRAIAFDLRFRGHRWENKAVA